MTLWEKREHAFNEYKKSLPGTLGRIRWYEIAHEYEAKLREKGFQIGRHKYDPMG